LKTIGNTLFYSTAVSVSYTLSIPSPVSTITASVLDTSSVSLTWSRISDASLGQPNRFVAYNISSYLNSQTSGSVYDVSFTNINQTTTRINRLVPGTSYFFTIRVQNTSGNSLITQSNTITTYKVPDPPTDIKADPSTLNQRGAIRFSWLPPLFKGVPSFTGFNFYYDTQPINNTSNHFFTDSSYQVGTIPNRVTYYYADVSNQSINTNYYYKVETVNSIGVSDGVLYNYQLSTPGIPTFKTPIPYTGTLTSNSVGFNYYSPNNTGIPNSILNYTFEISGTNIRHDVPGPGSTIIPQLYTFPDLSANTPYVFNITANNLSGSSSAYTTNIIRTLP
jgi:hypothetical protein